MQWQFSQKFIFHHIQNGKRSARNSSQDHKTEKAGEEYLRLVLNKYAITLHPSLVGISLPSVQ
jgi:hypothetical protein